MLIRNLLNRPNGTEVELDGKKYHFKPNEKGHEVCEVTDKAHIKRLLSIAEAYEPYDPDDAPVSTAVNTNMAGAQSATGGGDGGGDDDLDDDPADDEPTADTITDAQIDAMDKPTLLMWSQSYMQELEIKPSTPVHVMKAMVKKAAAERKAAAAAAAAGQGQEGQQ